MSDPVDDNHTQNGNADNNPTVEETRAPTHPYPFMSLTQGTGVTPCIITFGLSQSSFHAPFHEEGGKDLRPYIGSIGWLASCPRQGEVGGEEVRGWRAEARGQMLKPEEASRGEGGLYS